MEYSPHIRMYRVCIGYVSGMYRESVEGDGARGGTMDGTEKGICIDLLARKLAEI